MIGKTKEDMELTISELIEELKNLEFNCAHTKKELEYSKGKHSTAYKLMIKGRKLLSLAKIKKENMIKKDREDKKNNELKLILEDNVFWNEGTDTMRYILKGGIPLTLREEQVLLLRSAKLTYEKISQKLGISGERVRQILSSACRKLKHPKSLDALYRNEKDYFFTYLNNLSSAKGRLLSLSEYKDANKAS